MREMNRMKKSFISSVLCTGLVSGSIFFSVMNPFTVSAADSVEIDDITYELNTETNTYSVTHGIQSLPSADIKSEIDGIPVTSIGRGAFAGCAFMTSLKIPDSILSIDESAFYSCSGLSTINIPSSVVSIGKGAFQDCTKVKEITIPKNINTLSQAIFYNCTSLEKVSLPDTIAVIGQEAFYGCTAIKNISLPDSVVQIDTYAFEGCSGLKNINIPEQCVQIGDYAFEGCSGLENISVSKNNPVYDDENGILFSEGYTKLIKYPDSSPETVYIIPDNCTVLADWCFTGASKLKEIDLNNVTQIGKDAFFYCQSLKKIEIPNGVVEIPDNTFAYCSSLESVKIPSSVTRIGNYAFYTCGVLEEIIIPANVTEIGDYSFHNCLSMKNMTISGKLKDVGTYAFGMYSESQEDTPEKVEGFAVKFNGGSKVKSYVKQYDITFENTGGSSNTLWLVLGIVGGIIIIGGIVTFIIKKR